VGYSIQFPSLGGWAEKRWVGCWQG